MKKIMLFSCAFPLFFSIIFLFSSSSPKKSIESLYSSSLIEQKTSENLNPDDSLIFEGYSLNQQSLDSEIEKEMENEKIVDIIFRFSTDLSLPEIRIDETATVAEVDLALENYRKKVRKLFEESNRTLFLEFENIGLENVYISKYSPFVFAQIQKEDLSKKNYELLNTISQNENVDTLFIRKTNDITPKMTSAFPAVSLPSNLNAGFPYDGTGVNVGLLEYHGIVDASHSNFLNSNLTVRNVWYYTEHITEHAMRVGSIIGANTGIARGSHIFSVELDGNPSSEVEWLLDNNVNIINNSWGDTNPDGEYGSTSAYFDYIVYSSKVTVVCSAGNDGGVSGYVGNPGLGYNVITVGASYDSGNITNFSSYDEAFSISKPTLVAPGYSVSVPNFPNTEVVNGTTYLLNCGTSFSAPIVTGSIALLMERHPTLKLYPEAIIAIVTAAADPVSGFSDFDTSGLEEKLGAGLFDYSECSSAYYQKKNLQLSTDQQGSYVSENLIYLSAGSTVRISLVWIINSNNQTQTNKVTDFDLYLTSFDGSTLKSSCSGGNNIEFIEYVVTSSGNYRIKVFQYGAKMGSGTINMCYTFSY